MANRLVISLENFIGLLVELIYGSTLLSKLFERPMYVITPKLTLSIFHSQDLQYMTRYNLHMSIIYKRVHNDFNNLWMEKSYYSLYQFLSMSLRHLHAFAYCISIMEELTLLIHVQATNNDGIDEVICRAGGWDWDKEQVSPGIETFRG